MARHRLQCCRAGQSDCVAIARSRYRILARQFKVWSPDGPPVTVTVTVPVARESAGDLRHGQLLCQSEHRDRGPTYVNCRHDRDWDELGRLDIQFVT